MTEEKKGTEPEAPLLRRACVVCEQEKDLNRRNFAQSRTGLDGYAGICRKCHGLYGKAKENAAAWGEPPPDRDTFFRSINPAWNPAAKPAGRLSDSLANLAELYPALAGDLRAPSADARGAKNRKQFWDFISQATDALYDERVSEADRDDVVRVLKAIVLDDSRPDLGFRVLLETLRPLVAEYAPLGAVHDDILPALLSLGKRRLILASRNTAKSTIVAGYLSYRFLRNPLLTVTVISKSAGHAGRLLRAVRGYIERNPVLRTLKPEEESIDRQDAFVVGPAHGRLGMSQSLLSVGLGGQITGTRAHLVVLDDVEVANTHGTVEAVDRLEETFKEAAHLLQPGGEMITLGTPQTPFSVYGRLERAGVWEVTKARVFALTSTGVLVSRWIERWPDDELDRRRREVGPIQWSLHYDLSTDEDLSKAFPLKLRDLTVVDVDPLATKAPVDTQTGPEGQRLDLPSAPAPAGDWWRGPVATSSDRAAYIQTVCAIDPALGKAGRDAVGLSIVSTTASGQAYIRCAEAIRGADTAECLHRAAELVERHGVDTLVVETVGMQALWGQQLQALLVRRNYPLRVKDFNGGSQRKAARIIGTLAPVFASGRVLICRAVLEGAAGNQLAKEITQVSAEKTHTRNDDLVDSLSMAMSEISAMLVSDRPSSIAGIRSGIEASRHLSRRHGGAGSVLYEAMLQAGEAEMELESHIAELEGDIAESRRLGIPEPRLIEILNQRRRDLDQLRQN